MIANALLRLKSWCAPRKDVLALLGALPSELSTSNCPFCGSDLLDAASGQNCAGCGSRARHRSLRPLVSNVLVPLMQGNDVLSKPLLSVAITGGEIKELQPVFKEFKSVSLFGTYAEGHEIGVDVRDLSRYADNSFSGSFGCLVFDYFPEHEAALKELFRVTATHGIFITHISPDRVKDGTEAASVKKTVRKSGNYFHYLPDDAELSDIHVGREWFVHAMQVAGFATKIVRVLDAPTGVISEWFIGIKPEHAIAPKPLVKTLAEMLAEPYATVTTDLFKSPVLAGGANALLLSIEEVDAKTAGGLAFMEDHQHDGKRTLVATNLNRKAIFTSQDNGNTWQRCYAQVEFEGIVRQCITQKNGGRIVFAEKPNQLYHFNAAGELTATHAAGNYAWHGSQGISESKAGVVMYAEYAPLQNDDAPVMLSVWRLKPNATAWEKVMTLEAAAKPPQGVIRHFHVCRYFPEHNRWILATGDIREHNRMWVSENDGDNWREIHVKESPHEQIAHEERFRTVRLTSIATCSDGRYIWATDDTLFIKKSAVITMKLTDDGAEFEHIAWLGANCARNIISMGNDVFLIATESKGDKTAAQLFLVDMKTKLTSRVELPNLSMVNSFFTGSIGSAAMLDNMIFLPNNGTILSRGRGMFRLKFEPMPVTIIMKKMEEKKPDAEKKAFIFDPKTELDIHTQWRVVIYNNETKDYIKREAKADGSIEVPVSDLDPQHSYKYKIQVIAGGTQWLDATHYTPLARE